MASAIISIAIFFVLLIDDVVVSYQYYYYSLAVLFVLLFLITFAFRRWIRSQVKYKFRTGKWTINTIVIGTGKSARKIGGEIDKSIEQNTLIGYVSTDNKNTNTSPLLGNLSQIQHIIEKNNIDEAIIALDDVSEMELFAIINQLYKFNIEIQFIPRLYEILTGSARIKHLQMSPLVSVTAPSMPDWQLSVKRLSDILISLLALIVLSPAFLYFSIKIKNNSKGPVFYRQERIGRYGKAFNILKFRTMYINSESGIPRLSSADDERITPVGRVLRKYRIDELPQFWNILVGDMSLVGPRPERRFYINQIVQEAPYYCMLYKIRPGLTSWGPIRIGYSDTIEKMIERLNYDIIYIDNMSLLTDLKILIFTVEIIFKGKGV